MSERAVEQVSVAPGRLTLAWKRYGVYALLLFIAGGCWCGRTVAAGSASASDARLAGNWAGAPRDGSASAG
jgi:hypothetical protein